MSKTILAAVLSLGFAGAALAGEGYATTGDWREVVIQPAATASSHSAAPAMPMTVGSFEFNNAANGQG